MGSPYSSNSYTDANTLESSGAGLQLGGTTTGSSNLGFNDTPLVADASGGGFMESTYGVTNQVGTDVTPEFTSNPSPAKGGGMNYMIAGAVIQSITGVFADMAETQAFKDKLDAQTSAKKAQANSVVTFYELQQQKQMENVNAVNRAFGDKLSQRGLEAIQQASLDTAASVESGTSGGTTDLATMEAYSTANLDKAIILAQRGEALRGLYSAMDINYNKAFTKIDEALLYDNFVMNTNQWAAGGASGASVLNNALMLSTDREKMDFFNTKPRQA